MMSLFRSLGDWVHQAINIILSCTLLSWYDKILSPTNSSTTVADSFPIVPLPPTEIITEIFLKLPPNSLLRFTCVSKSWLQLISSPDFVNSYLKLTANDKGCSRHRVVIRGPKTNNKFCCLHSLFYKEQIIEPLDLNFPVNNPSFSAYFVGSVNGLICLLIGDTFIWNPTIRKSKKLPKLQVNSPWGSTPFVNKYGFGYDKSRDDYKVVVIHYLGEIFSPRTVANVYSLRTDSWRTVPEIQGIFLANSAGKFVNGKLYWVSTTGVASYEVCNIISFDLEEETWEKSELPVCGGVSSHFIVGVVGSDLSLLYTSVLGTTTSDVWIMKGCGVNVSWTKMFSIEYPLRAALYVTSPPVQTFSIHFRESNKGEIIILFPPLIMIYNGSTMQLEAAYLFEECTALQIYVESLIDPLLIADWGRRNHKT